MNIDTKAWSVRSYNDGYAHITQRASGVIRTVPRSALPSVETLAMMHELTFNRTMRNAFHEAATK